MTKKKAAAVAAKPATARKPRTKKAAPTIPPTPVAVLAPVSTKPFVREPEATWARIAIGDLHTRSDTIDRVLEVLRRARAAAKAHNAKVVHTGDFWDARGTLSVRQMNMIADEFDIWLEEGIEFILVPGNHDQVSKDGLVHGLRWLAAYSNVTVVTEPELDEENLIAYFPWREDPDEQSGLFAALDGDVKFTIFAHAEVQGAQSNTGHKAPGRVTLAEIESVARACYVGHYHTRQKLGDRTWYLGTPYELNMAERNQPHGIALITSCSVDPAFLDFTDFPQHRRYQLLPAERRLVDVDGRTDLVRKNDVVELLWPFGTAEEIIKKAVAAVPAVDVRPVPLPQERDPNELPNFALTLDDAVAAYVAQEGGEDVASPELISFGRAILAEVPSSSSVVPLFPIVYFDEVVTRDFCQIRHTLRLPFIDQKMVLLRGEPGIGKTSFVDSITWCLYGTTSPRKAAATTASLKGDEVINDNADDCSVQLHMGIEIVGERRRVIIERTKKRGQGDRVTISGLPEADGVRDQQERINRIVGMDYAMWRASCSLGQGDVGSFLTGADKSRKQLLSTVFGFDAVAAAQKQVKARLSPIARKLEDARFELAKEERSLEELKAQDFTRDATQWADNHAAELARYRDELATIEQKVAYCDEHLKTEQAWQQHKTTNEARLAELQGQLSGLPIETRGAQLQQELGAQQAELSTLERDVPLKRTHLQQAMAAREQGTIPCPTCMRPFDSAQAEAHVQKLEQELVQLESQKQTTFVRVNNTQQTLRQLHSTGGAQREGVLAQITEVNTLLAQVAQAMTGFATLHTNRRAAEERKVQLQADIARADAQVNPFAGKQGEITSRQAQVTERLRELGGLIAQHMHSKGVLEFWEEGFSSKGIPVLMIRAGVYELEQAANRYLRTFTESKIFVNVVLAEDDLECHFQKYDPIAKQLRARRYEQLSGSERRCAMLAFSPFGLGDLFRSRGVRAPILLIDELTTHLGSTQKMLVCDLLRQREHGTIIVIDHDVSVQGEFDTVLDMLPVPDESGAVRLVRQ